MPEEEVRDEPAPPTAFARRRLLGLIAAGGGVALAAKLGLDGIPRQPLALLENLLDPLLESVPPPGSLLVARGDDGLLLGFSFVNLELRAPSLGQPARLVLSNSSVAGQIVLGLGPQSLLERAFFDDGGGVDAPDAPVPALVSGPSRLVFTVPPGSAPVPYHLNTLLNLVAFPLATSAAANGTANPTGQPAPGVTAIEAPYRLLLSPPASAAFTASRFPVVRNGRSELWHARAIAQRLPDGAADERPRPVPVRAIWNRDRDEPITGAPWALAEDTVALTPADRNKLVDATTTPTDGVRIPAQASLLLVSAMGASLDITGAWPTRTDVVAWRHRSYLGRDNYVKVEEPGFLFPFGFRATRVKLTERIIDDGVAVLRKRIFIVVREPEIVFDRPDQPNAGRNLAFVKAVTTTLTSPPLLADPTPIGRADDDAFWIEVRGATSDRERLRYRLQLTDRAGRLVSVDLPMIFVPAGDLDDPANPQGAGNPAYDRAAMVAIVNAYNESGAGDRTMHLAGQRLAFVKPVDPATLPPGTRPEDSALPAFDVEILAEPTTGALTAAQLLAQRRLGAFPTMGTVELPFPAAAPTAAQAVARKAVATKAAKAQVRLEALDAVGGEAGGTAAIEYAAEYLGGDFGGTANAGEVWANVAAPPKLAVPQQTGGGLAAPQLSVQGLSRAFGPIADPAAIAKGDFRPDEYFKLPDITLLGGIPLREVVDGNAPLISQPRALEGDHVPKVVTVRTAQAVDTVITWKPLLRTALDNLFVPSTADADKRLELKAEFHTDLATGATSSKVSGELRDCTLNFVGTGGRGFISQQVAKLRFESRDGAKPSVDIQLGTTKFQGDLRFLNDLSSLLPSLPGGVKLDISPRGVTAGLTIALPAVAIGVVLIRNMSIGILFDLPFNGDQAILTFSFATRENPFQVTVSAFGGGGFLALGMGTRGVQQIEGALEFGAAVALDFGVASGSVSIMAGIYFKYAQRQSADGTNASPAGETFIITGYVRALGKLDVLGLIHVTVEFYLGLTYVKETAPPGLPAPKGRVQGVATLTIRVEVLILSKDVSVSMRKEFAGGPDPTFGQQITAGDWAAYCAAFATA
ncbi:hypothetical protein [Catellatospora citrea]|uniref:Uncharacterized protein n=1 Tax=Catellatospora citrea TaxID=53366 RepID=A0A8J3KFI7_9ACTN|nr:hypothetical protein [Catellatospora citrea]RKE09135.1 hypothetical protein C8E86_4015 [Catellatospora citrea]GIF99689.1 hypothetical protein Cci01nite_47830 [Catellatospora citrea]